MWKAECTMVTKANKSLGAEEVAQWSGKLAALSEFRVQAKRGHKSSALCKDFREIMKTFWGYYFHMLKCGEPINTVSTSASLWPSPAFLGTSSELYATKQCEFGSSSLKVLEEKNLAQNLPKYCIINPYWSSSLKKKIPLPFIEHKEFWNVCHSNAPSADLKGINLLVAA